jgi:hypothetical protein
MGDDESKTSWRLGGCAARRLRPQRLITGSEIVG